MEAAVESNSNGAQGTDVEFQRKKRIRLKSIKGCKTETYSWSL